MDSPMFFLTTCATEKRVIRLSPALKGPAKVTAC
jgi:hypothetical protein